MKEQKKFLYIGELASGAPEEQAKPKKGKAGKPQPVEHHEPAVFTPPLLRLPLGRLDDTVECCDDSCRGLAHDIMDEGRHDFTGRGYPEPAWMIECCCCGTGQWTRPVEGVLQPKEEAWRFRDGRFEGQTIAEVLTHPRGLDYLTWAAQSHPRPKVREVVKNHMDSIAVAR